MVDAMYKDENGQFFFYDPLATECSKSTRRYIYEDAKGRPYFIDASHPGRMIRYLYIQKHTVYYKDDKGHRCNVVEDYGGGNWIIYGLAGLIVMVMYFLW